MTEPTGDKITITLKGNGANTPWVVCHSSSVEEAADILRKLDPTVSEALDAFDLGTAVALASVHFQAKVSLAAGLGNVTPVFEQPPNLPAAPASEVVAAPVAPVAAPPTPTWGSAPTIAQLLPPQPQYAAAPAQQFIAPPALVSVGGGAASGNGSGFHPPQPGPAPVGPSGFPMEWKYGEGKDGRQWKAWMSGQPKANLDAGQAKDPVQWIR